MALLQLLVSVLVIIVIGAAAFWFIDRGFTGEASQFAWIAKLIVAVLGLLAVIHLFGINF